MLFRFNISAFFFTFLVSITVLIILAAANSSIASSTPCKSEEIDDPQLDIYLTLLTKGFKQPVQLTHAGDKSGRFFITEQAGTIRIIKDGVLIPKPFLNIRERVKSGGEKGLLSVAFHPSYKKNGRFFVNYTSNKGFRLHTVVSEFRAAPDSNDAYEESEKIILEVAQPYSNHNGGQIAFGPDGYLYIGMGDGGAGNDPKGNGQKLSSLLGAILRIDVDKKEGRMNYTIPPDNPFEENLFTRPEIFAYGLRNPWRFSFDPLTGTLYAGDVGQNAREEIDVIESGKNYGWNIMEGSICTPGVNPNCSPNGLTSPIIDYGRKEGITVIGGHVYRGSSIPALCGAYIYGDFGSGNIWALHYKNNKVTWNKLLLKTDLSISSFGIDEDYEVYVVDYEGSIFRVRSKTTSHFERTLR